MTNNIASERTRLHLSQAELGEKIGVSGDVIRNWEDGTTEIKSSNLVSLAQLFKCSTDYLLDRTENRLVARGV